MSIPALKAFLAPHIQNLRAFFTHRNCLRIAAGAQAASMLAVAAFCWRGPVWIWFFALVSSAAAAYLLRVNWTMAGQVKLSFTGLLQSAENLAKAAQTTTQSGASVQTEVQQRLLEISKTSEHTRGIEDLQRAHLQESAEVRKWMKKLVSNLNEMGSTIAQMNDTMAAINSTTKQSGEVIRIVQRIALQTRVLSLNASIQAAHAGDAGLAFAVVAENVRTLADDVDRAAKKSAAFIEESLMQAEMGQALIEEADGGIRSINRISTQASQAMDAAEAKSRQQSTETANLLAMLSRIENQSQGLTAAALEAMDAASAVSDVSTTLRGTIANLPGFLDPPNQPEAMPVEEPPTEELAAIAEG